jgi:arylsulfatase A-like enzyme
MLSPLRLLSSLSAPALAVVFLATSASADAPKPNIVLIMVDDMGYADLGCYGQRHYDTPHLDRMATEGIRFTQAYSGCCVCAPARCALMTGVHNGHTLVRANSGGVPLPDAATTVAEVLRQAGYTVGGYGKWGLGDIDTEGVPEKQGFDDFFGYYEQWHAHNYYRPYLIDSGKKVDTNKQYNHYLIYDQMRAFIRRHKDERFFCYAPWTPPHAGYQIPTDDPAWQVVKDKPWTGKVKGHAAFNLMVDRQVGETLELLRELGLEKKTIVFFCSDNGPSAWFEEEDTLDSNGPLRGSKSSLYEGGIRVPLIVRWPGVIASDQVCNTPVYFPDFLPTLAELAGSGSRVPEGIDGLSFVPTLLGHGAQPHHEYLYWEHEMGRMQAVRRSDWKLVRHQRNRPWELYNLTQDIGEQHDLAAEHPNVVEELARIAARAHVDPPPQREPSAPPGRNYR